jgi:hypothetical protein
VEELSFALSFTDQLCLSSDSSNMFSDFEGGPEVWLNLPNLRRLALWEPLMAPELAANLVCHARLHHPSKLTHLFLACSLFDDWPPMHQGPFNSPEPEGDISALDLSARPLVLPQVSFRYFEEFLSRGFRATNDDKAAGGLRRITFIDVSGELGFKSQEFQ